jgi:hypothetical protein
MKKLLGTLILLAVTCFSVLAERPATATTRFYRWRFEETTSLYYNIGGTMGAQIYNWYLWQPKMEQSWGFDNDVNGQPWQVIDSESNLFYRSAFPSMSWLVATRTVQDTYNFTSPAVTTGTHIHTTNWEGETSYTDTFMALHPDADNRQARRTETWASDYPGVNNSTVTVADGRTRIQLASFTAGQKYDVVVRLLGPIRDKVANADYGPNRFRINTFTAYGVTGIATGAFDAVTGTVILHLMYAPGNGRIDITPSYVDGRTSFDFEYTMQVISVTAIY